MSTFDFDRRTLLLLVAVLVAAVGATMFFTRQSAPAAPVAVPLMTQATTASPRPDNPSPDAPSASASPAGAVVVEVVGKVRAPQVLSLPKGSRVIDAVKAAGGARPGVDTSDQNLARLLVDGEQIRIGLNPAPVAAPAPGSSASAGPIDINTATADVLEQIPGVGPVLAQRIIAYRDQNGGFASVEQLTEVSGIGEATFAQMAPMVTVGSGG